MKSLFEFVDYKLWLLDRLESKSGLGKGGRSRLCEAMACKTSYLSQVLNGNAQLSPEQADAVNRFFGHREDESEYFLLLLQLARAGTPSYREFISGLIEKARARRSRLKHRLDIPQKLSLEQKVKYYSSWHHAAIHVATTCAGLRTQEAIASRLGLELSRVARSLEFLVSVGLVNRTKHGYEASTQRIHLPDDSDLAGRYHSSWRFKSAESAERNDPSNLHYSSVITIGENDVTKVRRILVDAIDTVKSVVRESGADSPRGFMVDWFSL